MKKLLYFVLIAFASSITFSSCTEDEIVPTSSPRENPGGGGTFDPL